MSRSRSKTRKPVAPATIKIDFGQKATAIEESPSEPMPVEQRPIGPPVKVLLLEDRGDFRGVLGEYLVTNSYDVTSASSGIEGLRTIMNGRFDVILCDMMMPQMGGEMFYWAVTRVRPATKERFIFFTGHKNNAALEFFFRRINAKVLYKPFQLASLDEAIRDVMRKVS